MFPLHFICQNLIGVLIVEKQKQTWLVSMRMQVWSLASLSGLRIRRCHGVDHRHGSDPMLLLLWHRLAAVAPIRPLAWEHPYAAGMTTKSKKKEEGNLIPKLRSIRRYHWEAIRSWRWTAHEWDLCPYKRNPQKLSCPVSPVQTQREGCHLWTKNQALSRHWICPHLDLGLLSLQNREIHFFSL